MSVGSVVSSAFPIENLCVSFLFAAAAASTTAACLEEGDSYAEGEFLTRLSLAAAVFTAVHQSVKPSGGGGRIPKGSFIYTLSILA